jgi:transposase-like protein
MSMTMDDSIKRWTAKRKTALVIEIIQGKTTVAEASRSFDLSPSEIEGWIEDAKRGMFFADAGHVVANIYYSRWLDAVGV